MFLWTGMTDRGDSVLAGNVLDHWGQFSRYLNRSYAVGSLGPESLIGSGPPLNHEDDVDDAEKTLPNSEQPLVLKILIDHGPVKEKKSGRNLSRVSEQVQ